MYANSTVWAPPCATVAGATPDSHDPLTAPGPSDLGPHVAHLRDRARGLGDHELLSALETAGGADTSRSLLAWAVVSGQSTGAVVSLLDLMREVFVRDGRLAGQVDRMLSGRLAREQPHVLHLATQRGDIEILDRLLTLIEDCRQANRLTRQQYVEHLRGLGATSPGEPARTALFESVLAPRGTHQSVMRAYARAVISDHISSQDYERLMAGRDAPGGEAAGEAARHMPGGRDWLGCYRDCIWAVHRESMSLGSAACRRLLSLIGDDASRPSRPGSFNLRTGNPR